MTAKAPVMPRKPMSRQAIREILLADREEIVRQIHAKTGDIQEFFRLLNSNTTMWDATQPDPAPAFEAEVRVVRSA